MALENKTLYVDTKTVTAAGTPEALTTRDINCNSVFIRPLSTNTNKAYVVDLTTESKKIEIRGIGITLPIKDPSTIKIDVDTNGEGVEWIAV